MVIPVIPEEGKRCMFCGGFHEFVCPRVQAIAYDEFGNIRSVTLHADPLYGRDYRPVQRMPDGTIRQIVLDTLDRVLPDA